VTGARAAGGQAGHNHSFRGRRGVGSRGWFVGVRVVLSRRVALSLPAIEVGNDFDVRRHGLDTFRAGNRVDYVMCDEAQFYTTDQV
jgi:Thymidine kinase